MPAQNRAVVLIMGASGNIGSALCDALKKNYQVIGLDREICPNADESIICDLTDIDSIQNALRGIREKYGDDIASVIHLAAYFDFSGKNSPLYQKVNIEGTRDLLKALQDFKVERFIYSSTMLVHKAGVPGEKINEQTPLSPGWAYPQSKAGAEQVIREERGNIPCSILRLAGVYDENTAVPTLSYQIARIYEREYKSHLYAGDLKAGQAFLHKNDMTDLFVRVVDRRGGLPDENIMLAGEETVLGYQDLQNRIGALIFGEKEWPTLNLPEPVAKAGAWLEEKAEPIIPDAIDQDEKPFIKPFMIDLASDHYDLDISRARELLKWKPKHNIYDELAHLVRNLKADPVKWYEQNKILPPDWMAAAEEKDVNPDRVKARHEKE